jgi:NAD dependent epimerase/dehydratase family enzyme
MKNKKIVIAGGTGYIGQALAKYFGKENNIIILGRQVEDHENNAYSKHLLKAGNGYSIQYLAWDARTLEGNWPDAVDGADIIINLAGKSVNCRYHNRSRAAVINSRVQATKVIGEAIRRTITPPKLWINASSATIYRNTLSGPNDEFTGQISDLKKDNMPYSFIDRLRFRKNKLIRAIRYGKNSAEYKELDLDFSVKVCKAWESTFFEQRTPFTRKIALRAAVTLGEGGIMVPYLNLCKAGLGGHHGSGKQMFSWVHVEDVCRMVDWLWEQKELEGVFNCAAPGPVSNKTFMQLLRKATGQRFGLPAPAWMLELGAWLIGTETELMLKSRWVLSTRAHNEGFRFKYDTLEKTFAAIVSNLPRKSYRLF